MKLATRKTGWLCMTALFLAAPALLWADTISGLKWIEEGKYYLKNTKGTGSEMTYDPAEISKYGSRFKLDFVDPGGRGMDGYPNGGAGGLLTGGKWYPGDFNETGMPVRLSDLTDLGFAWGVDVRNAYDDDDKWQATINFVFDGGTTTSRPVEAERDYDLVICSVSHNFKGAGLVDKPKEGPTPTYWWFARYPNGDLRTFNDYAIRYKFLKGGDKADKVQVKFIHTSKPPTSIYVRAKDYIDASKEYLQYVDLPPAERALANDKVADPTLFLKSIGGGYEVYTGKSILMNTHFIIYPDGRGDGDRDGDSDGDGDATIAIQRQ